MIKRADNLSKFGRLNRLMRRLSMRDYTWSGNVLLLPMWRRTGKLIGEKK